MNGIEAVFGHHIINDFRRHIHRTYIVGIIINGQRNISHPEGNTQIFKSEIFILNPGQVHSCCSEEPSGHSYKILSISPETILKIASQISEKSELPAYFKDIKYTDNKLIKQLTQLFDAIENPETDLQVESKIHSFLSSLILNFSKTPPSVYKPECRKESITRVCDYIEKHCGENISLAKLANVACLSPFHFQRAFKKETGITPHEYLNDFRISLAKKLLLSSDDVADIALQTGFFDQSHFSRVFRKAVGIPPKKYRDINRPDT